MAIPGLMSRMGPRGFLAIAACLALGACSTVNDLVGGEPDKPATTAPASTPKTGAAAEAAKPATPGDYPNLATTPSAPPPSATPTQVRAIRDGLVADREQAKHSAETLRGGGEPSAPPPPPAAPANPVTPKPATAVPVATPPAPVDKSKTETETKPAGQ